MTDWRARLREGDPGRDAVIPEADVRRMRAVLIAAAHEAVERRTAWSRAFLVAATTLVLVCASMLTALQRTTREEPAPVAGVEAVAAPAASSADERQQLHFETPGGTRIIWVFDSKFDVKGTLP
jgi:hypothetical protein